MFVPSMNGLCRNMRQKTPLFLIQEVQLVYDRLVPWLIIVADHEKAE